MRRNLKNVMVGFVVMFFSLLPNVSSSALLGDFNNDEIVSISEVQTCINSFLGITNSGVKKYALDINTNVSGSNVALTTFDQLIQRYIYNSNGSGNVLGINQNNTIGIQLGTNGVAYFYSVHYLSTGYIDTSYTPYVMATGTWSYIIINNTQIMYIDTSPVRGFVPSDIFYSKYNGVVYKGVVVNGPTDSITKSSTFTSNIIAGKKLIFNFEVGPMYVNTYTDGTASISNGANLNTGFKWSINQNGELVFSTGSNVNLITLSIVSSSNNVYQVAYTYSFYTMISVTNNNYIGPISLTIQ